MGAPYLEGWFSHGGEVRDAGISPGRTFWRYYFAGQALAGLCAQEGPWVAAKRKRKIEETPEAIAGIAALIADALLAKLEGEEEVPGA